jgi:hypothetical protein
MKVAKLISVALLLALGTGCTANPQPVPLPIKNDSVYLSGTRAGSDRAFLAGQPGAVQEATGGMEVVVENIERAVKHRGAVGDNGSFILQVERTGMEKLEMWVELGDQAGPRVEVKTINVMPPTPPVLDVQITTVGAVTSGQVEVKGTSTGADVVLVANEKRNVSQAAKPESTGDWTVTIMAEAGDELLAFAVEEGFLLATEPIRVSVK